MLKSPTIWMEFLLFISIFLQEFQRIEDFGDETIGNLSHLQGI